MAQHPHAGGLGTLLWYYQHTDSRVTISPTVEFTYNAHEDIMGSASYYTKQTGAVYEEHIYDAWGGVRWSTGHGVNDGKTLVIEPNYTGHSYDPILKIYHAEARFYDGKTRQWMASDPIKDGLNWYAYCESNPTNYVDPTGLFIVVVDGNGSVSGGTEMSKGAHGDDVRELQEALNVPKIPIGSDYIGYTDYVHSSVFDSATQKAVEEHQRNNGYKVTGTVTPQMWYDMGLGYNTTLEEEFKIQTPTRANPTVRVSVEGNDITISYFPQFYVQVVNSDKNGKILFRAATDTEYDKYAKAFYKSLEDEWKGNFKIQGLDVNVKLEINKENVMAGNRDNANVYIAVGKTGQNIVSDAFFWNMNKNLGITLRVTNDNELERNARHEFGHVLGNFDVYGYQDNPGEWFGFSGLQHADNKNTAHLNNDVAYNNIMDHLVGKVATESINVEMVLYAFSENRLQQFYDTILLGKASQALYR